MDAARIPVDPRYLALEPHLDVEAIAEELGRRDQEMLLLLDDVADKIGQAAVRE